MRHPLSPWEGTFDPFFRVIPSYLPPKGTKMPL